MGQYEYLVMPYRLANSPSIFQSFIRDVWGNMLNHFIIAYIDDILIHSNDLEQHMLHVRQVLQRLKDHQLHVKGEKCEFHCTSVKILGYCIQPGGVEMDEDKAR